MILHAFFTILIIAATSLSAVVRFVAGPPVASTSTMAINPNMLFIDGNSAATITITARDTQGNLAPYMSISLRGSGSNNTFEAANGNTDGAGQFVAMHSSVRPQTETITASLSSSAAERQLLLPVGDN